MSDLAAHIRALDPLWIGRDIDSVLTNIAPALADLVEAVEQHQRLERRGDSPDLCEGCFDGYIFTWPCPTARALDALAAALGVTE